MSHTPTPFEAKELHNNYDGFVLLYKTPGGKRRVDNKQGVFTKEDAYFIVQAVNSFEAMREVLEELTRDIEAVGVKETGKEWPDLLVTYNKAKQALAAAEGKEVGR